MTLPQDWDTIEKHPDFNGFDDETKKAIRSDYFDEHMAQDSGYQKLDNATRNVAKDDWTTQTDSRFVQKHGVNRKEQALFDALPDSGTRTETTQDSSASGMSKLNRSTEPEVQPVAEDRGIVGDVVSHVARGVNHAASMAGGALQTLDGDANDDSGFLDTVGKGLQHGAEKAKHYTMLRPDQGEVEQEGFVKRGVMSGLESLPASSVPFATGAAGMKTGAVIGSLFSPAGTVVGGAIGGAVGGMAGLLGMFGLGTYFEENKAAKEHLAKSNPGMSQEEIEGKAHGHAWKQAAIETGGEFVGDVAGIVLFGGGKALTQPIKATIRNLFTKSPKELAIQFGKDIPIEVATEMAQGAGQTYNSAKMGMTDMKPHEAAIESIIPAITMSLFMGSAISGVNQYQARKLMNQVNSDDADIRHKAINQVAHLIEKNTGDSSLASHWHEASNIAVQENEQINFDERVVDFASAKLSQEIAESPNYRDPVEAKKGQALDIIRKNNSSVEDLFRVRQVPELLEAAGVTAEDIDGLIAEKAAEADTLKEQLQADPDQGVITRAAVDGLEQEENPTVDTEPILEQDVPLPEEQPVEDESEALQNTFAEIDALNSIDTQALDTTIALADEDIRVQAESMADAIVRQDPVQDQVDWVVNSGSINKEAAIKAWGERNVKLLQEKYQNIISDGGVLDVETTAEKLGFPDSATMLQAVSEAPSLREETARIVSELEAKVKTPEKETEKVVPENNDVQEEADNSPKGIVKESFALIKKASSLKEIESFETALEGLPAEYEPFREELSQAIAAKRDELSEGKDETKEKTNDLVPVKDNRGTTHYIKQKDLDNPERTILPRYKKDGSRFVEDNGVHRDNLDPDGEKAKALGKDTILIDGRNGKGFKAAEGVKRAIKKIGQSVEDFDIREIEGRFVGFRKDTESSTEKEPATIESVTKELEEAVTSGRHSAVPALKAQLEELQGVTTSKDAIKAEPSQSDESATSVTEQDIELVKAKKLTKRQKQVMDWMNEGNSLKESDWSKPPNIYVGGEEKYYLINKKVISKLENMNLIRYYPKFDEWYSVEHVESGKVDNKTDKVVNDEAEALQSKPNQETAESENKTPVEPENPSNKGESDTKQGSESNYGQDNKLVSLDRREEIKKKLREKLNNLNAGFDPELFALGSELAIFHIEAGARKFADYSNAMIEDVGEAITPFLRQIYEGIRYTPDLDTSAMSDAEDIELFLENEGTVGKEMFGRNLEKANTLMLDSIGAGGFDGGCVTCAMAIQKKLGGELYALTRPSDNADHAVVKIGSDFYDMDGIAKSEKEIIARFNENEMAHTTGSRPLREDDLSEAPRIEDVANQLAELLIVERKGNAEQAPNITEQAPNISSEHKESNSGKPTPAQLMRFEHAIKSYVNNGDVKLARRDTVIRAVDDGIVAQEDAVKFVAWMISQGARESIASNSKTSKEPSKNPSKPEKPTTNLDEDQKPDTVKENNGKVIEKDFRKSLERKGSARDARGVDYKILQAEGDGKGNEGSYYYQSVEDGVRIEHGAGYPSTWSRQTTIDKAVKDAHFSNETGQDTQQSDRLESGGSKDEDILTDVEGIPESEQSPGTKKIEDGGETAGVREGSKRPVRGSGTTDNRTDDKGTSGELSGQSDKPETSEDGSEGADESGYVGVSAKPVDYHISDSDTLGSGGASTKARANVKAIKILKRIQKEDRPATKEEQQALVKYVGWGSSELANGIFPVKKWSHETRESEMTYKKGWATMGKELESLLTKEEYADAKRSTLNAHYTSKEIIDGMYLALEQFGYKGGGRAIEPGSGVGHFVGLLPENMPGTQFTTVEMDSISAGIAEVLYPNHTIKNQDYAKFKAPKNFFDFAIGNPPFDSVPVLSDKEYAKHKFALHDFFFAKTIDKVRPGGVMMLVTSRYTMDKAGDKARHYLGQRADFLGAIRLPQTAFKKNAGTDVVTDVIFLQKREEGKAKGGVSWNSLKTIKAKDKNKQSYEFSINEYFADNPEMILGSNVAEGSMYAANQYTVKPKQGDIGEQFAKAVSNLPKNIYEQGEEVTDQEVAEVEFAPDIIKEGGFFLDEKGNVLQKEDGVGVDAKAKGKKKALITDFITLRDAVREVLYVQLAEKGSLEDAQQKLEEAYQSFTDKHGAINKATKTTRTLKDGTESVSYRYPNFQPFSSDPDSYRVAAIEIYDLDTGDIKKADIFTQRVISPTVEPKVESLTDALHVSMYQSGRVDTKAIADMMGVDEQEAIDGLGNAIYHDPDGRKWVTDDEYLSGNVKEKLANAKDAAELDKKYNRNVKALESVQPEDLPASRVNISLGMPIIANKHIKRFAAEVLDMDVAISRDPISNDWKVKAISGYQAATATSDYGTPRRNAAVLLDHALNGKSVIVRDEDGDGKSFVNKTKTETANAKLQKIKTKFTSWIWEEAERADDLLRKYNDEYNNTVKREYGGDHISVMTFPGLSSSIKPYEHQKRAAWRIIQSGNTYMAHSVGAGKTIASIIAGMEMKRLGIKKKPVWAVPNHMLKQFSSEFLDTYPAAKILVADEQQFTAKNRNRFMGRVAVENWDAIIITHAAFKKIPMSAEFQAQFIEEQLEEVEVLMQEAKEEGEYAKTKQIERQKKALQAQLEKIMSGDEKDKGVTFEETGIDQIFVDEAHEFRKLSFVTKKGDLKGVDPKGSQLAFDLYTKTQYLESLTPGRSLVLMSGTPVTNTLGEVFAIQRYLQGDKLKELGIDYFDGWAATFGDTVTNIEATPAGTYKPVTRFAKFNNMPALSGMWAEIGDYVHAKDLHYITRPSVVGGSRKIEIGESSDIQKNYKKELGARIKAIEARSGQAEKGQDIILSVITDGRHAAMDDKYIDPSSPVREDSKMSKMVSNVEKIWRDTKEQKSVQMVFADLGMPGSLQKRGFSTYLHIKEELVKRGIPENEVVFMQDYKKSDQKIKLYKELNAGKVRVIIGSSQSMGTGVNAQERLVALHHFDPNSYLPSNIEQREGRIVRQGNSNKEVHLFAYVTRGSYDETMWQFLETKQRFIDQFLSGKVGDDSVSDIDGSSDSYAMAKAMSSDNPLILEMAGVENELNTLRSLYNGHLESQRSLRFNKSQAQSEIESNEKRIKQLNTAIQNRIPTKGKSFSMKVDGKEYTDRTKAGKAYLQRQIDMVDGKIRFNERVKLGDIAGFELWGSTVGLGDSTFAKVNIIDKESGLVVGYFDTVSKAEILEASPSGVVRQMENQAQTLDRSLTFSKDEVKKSEAIIKDADARIGSKFEYQESLNEKQKRLEEIKEELDAQGKETPEDENAIALSDSVEEEGNEADEADLNQADEIRYSRKNKQAWPENFPNVKVHTTLTKMRSHQDYEAAKSGDVKAAIRLVRDIAKPEINKELFRKYPDAIVVVPHAIEASGQNAIPRVFAEDLKDAGFQVDTEIVQSSKAQRTKKKAALRLAVLPEFDGKVEKGREYIIIDDAIGAGGTVNELRYHIESNGGKVVFVTTLTQGMYAAKVSVKEETVRKIEEKHGRTESDKFIQEFNTAGTLEALTEKQARTILKSASLDTLRNRILTQAREAGVSPSTWEVRRPLQIDGDSKVKYSLKDQSTVKLKETGEATDERSKEDVRRLQRNVAQEQHGRQDDGRNGGGRTSGISFTPVKVSPELTRNVRRLSKLFGKRVVFFRANNNLSDSFNGATLPKTNPDVIYINVNNEYLPYTVLGHELGHLLRQESPKLYEQLKAILTSPGIIKREELVKYREKYNLKLSADGLAIASDSYITEEFISNFLGDNFTNEAFWKRFAEKDLGLFRTVIKKALDFLNNVLKHLSSNTSLKTNIFFKDIEKARDAMAWTMAQYAKERKNPAKAIKPVTPKIVKGENFKKWFGKSIATDQAGTPAVLYHGSPATFTEFKEKSGKATGHTSSGLGSFFTPSQRVAQKYSQGGNVIAAHLRMEKPYTMTLNEAQSFRTVQDSIDRRRELEAKGYDSVIIIVKGSPEASQIIVFDSNQVKSAKENTGEFSRENNDIRYSTKGMTLEKEIKKNEQEILEVISDRTDSSSLERVLSTFEYISQKSGATKRMMQAHLDRRDEKFRNEERILGDFVPYMEKLQKEDPEAYKAANKYILKIDKTGKGYRIKRDTGHKVSTPEGETVGFAINKKDAYALAQKAHSKRKEENENEGIDFVHPATGKRLLIKDFAVSDKKLENFTVVSPKKDKVGTYEDEQEAVTRMINAERAHMLFSQRYNESTIDAVSRFREMTNKALDEMVADLRAILDAVREQGDDEPTVPTVDESRRWAVLKKGSSTVLGEFESESDAKGAILSLSKADGKYSALTVKKQKDSEIRKEMNLSEIISMMGDLRGVYYPRQRTPGGVILKAVNKDGDQIMKKFDLYMTGKKHIDSETGVEQKRPMSNWLKKKFNKATGFIPFMDTLEKEARRLNREGYTVTVDRDKSMPEAVFEPAQLIATLDALMNESLETAKRPGSDKDSEFIKEVNAILTANVAKIFQTRGYLSSRAKRTNDYWSGFEEDMLTAGTMYARGLAAGFAKRDAARKMTLALAGRDIPFSKWQEAHEEGSYDEYLDFVEKRRVNPSDQKQLYSEAIGWMKEVLRNEEQVDRIMGTVKGLGVQKFLGFRVSSAAVNLTNMVQAVPATISSHSGGSVMSALNQVRKTTIIYGKYRSKKGKVSEEDRAIFQYITDSGWDDAQFNTENASVLMSKLGKKWSKFTEYSMMMFGAAEKANRAITIHAAYKQFRANTDVSHEEALQKAKHASDRAHGVYGKGTAPAWTRGAANPLKLTYTFQKFMHNYVLNMVEMGFKGDHKQAAYMLVSPAILAGAGASALTPLLAALFPGDDPEEEFYKWAEETFGSDAFARHGLFGGLFGVNIKGSLQMNNPFPTRIGEVFGAPQSVITDIGKSVKHFSKGEVLKGSEAILPTGFGSMLKSAREYDEGVTTSSYSQVFYGDEPLKGSGLDAFLRFFSFNPSRLSGIREKQWNEKQVAAKYQARKKAVTSKIKHAMIKNDGDISARDWAEIQKEIARYNDLVRGSGRNDIRPITRKSVRRIIRGTRRAPRRERLRRVAA